MRTKTIKVSFEHPNYIYPFKLSLGDNFVNMERVMVKETEKAFEDIVSLVVLTEQQKQIIASLDFKLKYVFVNEYHKTLKLRADVDMIGHNLREHYEYFADRCQHTLTAKEVLELHNYLSRRRKLAASSCPSANNNDPNSREWVQLILNYLAGVNSGGVVIDERYIAATAAIQTLKEQVRRIDQSDLKVMLQQIGTICRDSLFGVSSLDSHYQQLIITVVKLSMTVLSKIQGQLQLPNQAKKQQDNHTMAAENVAWLLHPQLESIKQAQVKHPSLFEIIMRKLQDTRNLLHVEAVVDLIELLFRSVQSFRDKLFLITEALRLGILNALEKVEMRICQREYQHRQAIVNSVYIEGFQLRSGQKLDLHRLKDLMKSQKLSSHEIQPKLKKVLKTVKNHVEQFRSYRNGKISFKVSHKQNYQSLKDNGANKEGKIASDQQKVRLELTGVNWMNETVNLQLLLANEELVNLNQLYKEQLQQKESIIAELLSFGKIRQYKPLKLCSKVYAETFQGKNIRKGCIQSELPREKQKVNIQVAPIKASIELVTISSSPELSYLPPPPPPPTSIDHTFSNLPLPPPPALLLAPLTNRPSFSPLPLPPAPLFTLQSPSNAPLSKPKKQMKSIRWNVIDNSKLQNTIWETNEAASKFDQNELVTFFSKSDDAFLANKVEQSQKPVKLTVLKPDRMKNVEIVLRKIKIGQTSIGQIESMFLSYHESDITEDVIDALIGILPTDKEKQAYNKQRVLPSQFEQWSLSDQFFMKVCAIPDYEKKLQAIMFKFDFSRQAELYFKKLREFIDFFVELKHDIFLQEFLLTFRSIGNYLNNGSRSAVKAFRIESIEKCYTLIGQDKETSLFDFICKTIYKDDPNLFDICKTYRLKNVVSLAVLVQDLKVFWKKCSLVQDCIILSEASQDDNSDRYFLPFYLSTMEELNAMEMTFDQAKKAFKQAQDLYGQKAESEQIGKIICDFRGKAIQYAMKRSKYRK